MNTHKTHPDSEQLDSLRAGLLDDDPQRKADIETHLNHCAACRQRYDLAGHLQPGRLPVAAPGAELEQIRQQALETRSARPRRLFSFAVAAALALVAVVLVKPSLQDTPPADTRVAQKTPQEITPVLYEDLDFYLWLADHKENSDSST